MYLIHILRIRAFAGSKNEDKEYDAHESVNPQGQKLSTFAVKGTPSPAIFSLPRHPCFSKH